MNLTRINRRYEILIAYSDDFHLFVLPFLGVCVGWGRVGWGLKVRLRRGWGGGG